MILSGTVFWGPIPYPRTEKNISGPFYDNSGFLTCPARGLFVDTNGAGVATNIIYKTYEWIIFCPA